MSASPLLLRAAAAVRAANLRFRNWSGGGEIVLAIYEADGESFVGTLQFTDARVLKVGSRWWKKDEHFYAAVSEEFARLTS
jgi:hypothetical protein